MKIQDLMSLVIAQAFLSALLMPTRGLQIVMVIEAILVIIGKYFYTRTYEEEA